MTTISIIIPCFNDGVYLDEAVQSVQLDRFKDEVEVIIVNDGSTDPLTLSILDRYDEKGIRIVHQSNQGLGAARNAGIQISKGKYILPLDADNKLYMDVCMELKCILEEDDSIDVCYSDLVLFGESQGYKSPPDFDGPRLLAGNYIDACALVRATCFKRFGGYASDMPAMGHEDWELWVRLFASGCKFFHYDKAAFAYRVRKASMIHRISLDSVLLNREYIQRKYAVRLAEDYVEVCTSLTRQLYESKMEIKRLRKIKESLERSPFRSLAKVLLGRELA